MRNTLAFARKELRIYLTTWTSYVLVGAFVALTAFFFSFLVQEFQQRRLDYAKRGAAGILAQMNLTDLVVGPTFSYVATFFVFMLPILTMRLIAEERRSKTLELLLSTPVRPIEILLGKYLAAWTVMIAMLAATGIFPLSLHFFADADPNAVDWNTVWAGYLGMALLGSAGVAVGLFASAVTESQVVAVVIGFAILLLLMVVGVAAAGSSWRPVLEHLSISHHMQGFARGLVRSPGVTYYASLTFLSLYFALRFLDAERWR